MNKLTLLLASTLLFLSACSKNLPNLPTLYKADVNQGSELQRFAINQLKVGMSKAEVVSLIGSPSIIDPFHNDQWDYINHSAVGITNVINYRLTLYFNRDLLSRIDAVDISLLPQLNDSENVLEKQRIETEESRTQIQAQAEQIAQDRKRVAAETTRIKIKLEAQKRAHVAAKIKAKAEARRMAKEYQRLMAKRAKIRAEKAAKAKIEQEQIDRKAAEQQQLMDEQAQAERMIINQQRSADKQAKKEEQAKQAELAQAAEVEAERKAAEQQLEDEHAALVERQARDDAKAKRINYKNKDEDTDKNTNEDKPWYKFW